MHQSHELKLNLAWRLFPNSYALLEKAEWFLKTYVDIKLGQMSCKINGSLAQNSFTFRNQLNPFPLREIGQHFANGIFNQIRSWSFAKVYSLGSNQQTSSVD